MQSSNVHLMFLKKGAHKYAHTEKHTHRHTHTFPRHVILRGMAQVAQSCQDVSLERELHEDLGRADMAIAYL